jgi:hypothetical protein
MWIKAFEIMPYLSNLQTFRLKCSNSKEAIEKINKMLIVEPFERLNIFYDRLCSHFGVQYPLLHLNTCSFKLDVSENIKTWIKEKNTMDMVLWNYCLNIKKNY